MSEIPFRDAFTSEDELRAIVGRPSELAVRKEIAYLDAHCRAFIARSPFVVIATAGASGRADVSPKGDPPGFVQVLDDHRLVIPDRPGNRRLDGMRNLLENPHVGLLFLIPGLDETLRVNGRGRISIDPALLESFAVESKLPRSVLIVTVEKIYFQCSKALVRSKLWDPESWPPAQRILFGRIIAPRVGGDEAMAAAIDERVQAGYTTNLWKK